MYDVLCVKGINPQPWDVVVMYNIAYSLPLQALLTDCLFVYAGCTRKALFPVISGCLYVSIGGYSALKLCKNNVSYTKNQQLNAH